MEVAVVDRDQGIQLCCQVMNKHCYLPVFASKEPMLRRSIELQHDMLVDLFEWELLLVNEDTYKGLKTNEEKRMYLYNKMDDENEGAEK